MANEKRLIDANALHKLCNEQIRSTWNHNVRPESWSSAYEDFRDAIDEAPTVDAVEVAEYDAILYKLECLLCHATGGKYSKAGYSWEAMERMVTDYIEECCEEAVAEEVGRGYWIDRPLDNFRKIEVKCSECGWTGIENYDSYVDPSDFNYCPNCGAKMDGDGDG